MKADFPILKTERLLLRQFVDTDLDNVYKGLSHPNIIQHYGVSYETLEATKTQMAWYAELEKNETGIWWAVCSADNQVFYGAGGLNGMNHVHKKGEIGFWLLTEFWGLGLITEAMRLICRYAFDEFGLHRIEGFVESENTASKNVMRKLHFDHEGTMQDCEIKNGRYISLDIYAKINHPDPIKTAQMQDL